MWRDFNVDTRRRIRKVWRKKAPIFARDNRRWNQATGPISATICSVLEAGWKQITPGFWQTPDASATLDGALFNKAQIIDSFSRDMEMQMEKSGWAFAQCVKKKKERYHHRLCPEGQVSADQRGSFMVARALDILVCGAINEPHLPADGSIPNQFSMLRLRPERLGHQEA